MKVPKIFSHDEPIAGLAITDAFLRIALLQKEHTAAITELKFVEEEALPVATVAKGIIQKPDALIAALKKLRAKLSTRVQYVVLSIPPDPIYSRVYSFPKTIRGEKLLESINLTINFQLPNKPEESYASWQTMESDMNTDVLLASAPKTVIDAYISALTNGGFHPIAIEFHPTSIGRILATPPEQRTLITMPGATTASLFVFQHNMPRFGRIVPITPETKLEDEAEKIINYYEADNGAISTVSPIDKAPINDVLAHYPKVKAEGSKWYSALGAAFRGLEERQHDLNISLMPVSTQAAYEYQRAVNFATILTHAIVVLSLFFMVVYAGSWTFMNRIQQQTITQIDTFNTLPVAAQGAQIEQEAQKASQLIDFTNNIIVAAPQWSKVINELRLKGGPEITITGFTTASPVDFMTINGVATDRITLNAFKKRLEESELFAEIKLPLTNLEQKERIPFSLTVKLRNPASITYQ